jgi:hypothetical protein
LNGVALPAISKRCFETRYVMLQQHSLENLIEISRHRVFGPALRTLTICIDHLTAEPQDNRAIWYWGDEVRRFQEGDVVHSVPDRSSRETAEEAVVHRGAYDLLLEDQSGLNTTYLMQAMATLPNLETVMVENAYKPWGATVLKRQTGLSLTNTIEALDSIDFVERALRAIRWQPSQAIHPSTSWL